MKDPRFSTAVMTADRQDPQRNQKGAGSHGYQQKQLGFILNSRFGASSTTSRLRVLLGADSEGNQRKYRGGEYENQQRYLVTGAGIAVGQILKTPGVITPRPDGVFPDVWIKYQKRVN
jgi:hypothetical protein